MLSYVDTDERSVEVVEAFDPKLAVFVPMENTSKDSMVLLEEFCPGSKPEADTVFDDTSSKVLVGANDDAVEKDERLSLLFVSADVGVADDSFVGIEGQEEAGEA